MIISASQVAIATQRQPQVGRPDLEADAAVLSRRVHAHAIPAALRRAELPGARLDHVPARAVELGPGLKPAQEHPVASCQACVHAFVSRNERGPSNLWLPLENPQAVRNCSSVRGVSHVHARRDGLGLPVFESVKAADSESEELLDA